MVHNFIHSDRKRKISLDYLQGKINNRTTKYRFRNQPS